MSLLGLILLANLGHAAIVKKAHPYKLDKRDYVGYLAYDDAKKGPRSAVLVLPEWWGLTQHEKDVADKLAALGYVVLVADLYGGGKTTEEPGQAKQMMDEAEKDEKALYSNVEGVLQLLRRDARVNPKRIAIVGYGFGGGLALDQARLGKDVRGIVNYYGGLSNVDRVPPKPVRADILVLVGKYDAYISDEQVSDFKSEMKGLKAKSRVVRLEAYHDFDNQAAGEIGKKTELPYSYDETASKLAWVELVAFLKRIL